MSDPPIDGQWLRAFVEVLERCRIGTEERVVVLCERHSREINVRLAELALDSLGARYYRLALPSPRRSGTDAASPLVRSTGASTALDGQTAATEALCLADVIVDLTVEGLMHAAQTACILRSGARILNVSDESPDVLARLVPGEALRERVREAVARCRSAERMRVRSAAGTDLDVSMRGATTVGVWGWTDRPGTLAHWPGGLVASFPAAGSVNGRLVFDTGDVNLTFKRYFDRPVACEVRDDHVVSIEGDGVDARLMRDYLESFAERAAYATSHVGWGLDPASRYESLTMYDRSAINGTELRTLAGSFLYSTGANEFAGRFTRGHFDLPMLGCTITLDGETVVERGRLAG